MKQLLASLTAVAFLLTGTAMAGAAPKAKTITKAAKSHKDNPMQVSKPKPKATKKP